MAAAPPPATSAALDLVQSLWGRRAVRLGEARPALSLIVGEDRRLQARLREVAGLIERVMAETAAP